jgi:plastocyanin
VTSKAVAFDSKAIAAGKAWTYRATKKGDFPYVCTLHPTMSGTIHVQ